MTELCIASIILKIIVLVVMLCQLFVDKLPSIFVLVGAVVIIAIGLIRKDAIDIVCWTILAALYANLVFKNIG